VFDPRENALVFKRINGSDSRVYGFSAEFGYQFGNSLYFKTGWTFQSSRRDEPEPDFGAINLFRTPGVYGYARVHHENKRLVNIDCSLEYTGSMQVPHYAGYIADDRLETSTPFWILNTKFSKPITLGGNNEFSIFAGIFNLLDSYQKDLDMGIYRDAGYVYGPSKPRAFYAGFEFGF
jgi:outer membrane receptor for ferrienterochelin and colicins